MPTVLFDKSYSSLLSIKKNKKTHHSLYCNYVTKKTLLFNMPGLKLACWETLDHMLPVIFTTESSWQVKKSSCPHHSENKWCQFVVLFPLANHLLNHQFLVASNFKNLTLFLLQPPDFRAYFQCIPRAMFPSLKIIIWINVLISQEGCSKLLFTSQIQLLRWNNIPMAH